MVFGEKNRGRLEILISESKIKGLYIWRLGYNFCNVYERKDDNTIGLWSFGCYVLCKDFYYSSKVYLPRKIKKYFDGNICSEENIKKMEALGIYSDDYIDSLTSDYLDAQDAVYDAKVQVEIERQKALCTVKTLRRGRR